MKKSNLHCNVEKIHTSFKVEKSELMLLRFEQIESEVALSKFLFGIGQDETVSKASMNFFSALSNKSSHSSFTSLSVYNIRTKCQ